jgi:orotate phosphoribosyltransferase
MKHIAQLLVDQHVVKTNFENPFVWASGIHSPIYCDCRELISQPHVRREIIKGFQSLIHQQKIPHEIIAGTATAGIPWASFMANELDVPMLYVRNKPKGHGAGKMVEGKGVLHKNILVVEDAVSTGGSSIVSVKALRNELQAIVEHVLAIFSWETKASSQKAKEVGIHFHSLTGYMEIVEALLESGKITPQEKNSLQKFHTDPQNWWENVRKK